MNWPEALAITAGVAAFAWIVVTAIKSDPPAPIQRSQFKYEAPPMWTYRGPARVKKSEEEE